jgi:hypothetical protein
MLVLFVLLVNDSEYSRSAGAKPRLSLSCINLVSPGFKRVGRKDGGIQRRLADQNDDRQNDGMAPHNIMAFVQHLLVVGCLCRFALYCRIAVKLLNFFWYFWLTI